MFLSKMLSRGVMFCMVCGLPASVFAQPTLYTNTVDGYIFGTVGTFGAPPIVMKFGAEYPAVTTLNTEANLSFVDFDTYGEATKASATISAIADQGELHTYVIGEARANGYGQQASASGFATASYVDHVTWLFDPLNSPSIVPVGTPITVSAHLDLKGEMSALAQGVAGQRAQNHFAQDYATGSGGVTVWIKGTGVETAPYYHPNLGRHFGHFSYTFRKEYLDFPPRTPPSDGVAVLENPLPATVRIVYTAVTGTPFPLTLTLETHGNAGASDHNQSNSGGAFGFFKADFSHTLKWGGIDSVTRTDTGEVLTGWTVTSASGFDYSRSFEDQVPEPSSLLLAATAALLLARPRHKRS